MDEIVEPNAREIFRFTEDYQFRSWSRLYLEDHHFFGMAYLTQLSFSKFARLTLFIISVSIQMLCLGAFYYHVEKDETDRNKLNDSDILY